MSAHAEVMKLRRAVELAETQSVESLRRYFERQRNAARSSGASKASQRLVSDPKVQEAMRKAAQYDDLHPKFRKARHIPRSDARDRRRRANHRLHRIARHRRDADGVLQRELRHPAVRRAGRQGGKRRDDPEGTAGDPRRLPGGRVRGARLHVRRGGGTRRAGSRSGAVLRTRADGDPVDPAQRTDGSAGRGAGRRPARRGHPRRGLLLDFQAPRGRDGRRTAETQGRRQAGRGRTG